MHRVERCRRRMGAAVLGLALAMLGVPVARGEQANVYRVGQLNLGSEGSEVQPFFDTFVATLRKLGYVEGAT